jgi:hypothetical protein
VGKHWLVPSTPVRQHYNIDLSTSIVPLLISFIVLRASVCDAFLGKLVLNRERNEF